MEQTQAQTFMMVFSYTPNPEYTPTQEDIATMRQDWGSFIGNLALKEKLESTNQLGFEGKQIAADRSVSEGVRVSENQMISGNMVVNAFSLDEAVELAKDCPILKMGGSIEVRNIMPMNN